VSGVSENAGHENVAQSKMQRWKTQNIKMWHKTAGMEKIP